MPDWLTILIAAQHPVDPEAASSLPTWLTIVIGVVGVVLGGGVQWGITTTRINRLEHDVGERASKESVDALSRRVDDNHDGLKETLGEIKQAVEGLRSDLARRSDNTNPGRH